MEEYNSSDDLDDDWFYESVTRYNTLQMFYLQNIPEHLLQLDENTVCIANKNLKCGNTELLQLKLPGKLMMSPEEEGRSKENDFKMLAGIYIEKPMYQMEAIVNEEKIVTSQFNQCGLQIYSFKSNDRDLNINHQFISSLKWITPDFAIRQENNTIACSKCSHCPIVLFDLKTGEQLQEIHHPFYQKSHNNSDDLCSVGNIKCQFLDETLLSVLESHTGSLSVIDLRTGNSSFEIKCESVDELWILSKLDFKTFSTFFGVLSNRGNFKVFDVRMSDKCLTRETVEPSAKRNCNLKLKMANRERFSVSGLDSNIYVHNVLKNSFELAFTHNGHVQKKTGSDFDALVNDHIWLPSIGPNFMASICNNKSLHCWEYNELFG